MTKRKHVFQIIIEHDEANHMSRSVRHCAGLLHQGKTYEEVIENIKDVIALCLEDLAANKKRIPKQPEIIDVSEAVEVLV